MISLDDLGLMPLHLIKLAVGADTISDLVAWQTQRLEDMRRAKKTPELIHITRHAPRRAEEVLDDGSLYWVIKGWIAARQKLLELRPVVKDGLSHCALVYDQELIAVAQRPCRAFQGWRYLDPKEAPPDRVSGVRSDDLPEELRRDLMTLGLL